MSDDLARIRQWHERMGTRVRLVASLEGDGGLVAHFRDVSVLFAEIDRRDAILHDLTDPDDCRYDHHGYCQTHGWLEEGICPHKRAKELRGDV
jgi:hypothetical protein